ncbi:PadR family transcriptional regulator [Frankia sp. AgB1.9]|uniref:PadR family transcriptional regulator n=1 Tax=unclassified Frankia TaxID=2632575 RepID=UPI001934050D|nr:MULTISPECIES: PadR family transcriptional regulator [unclassified Frankia]MBL7493661.1 PadR family transcriptional regulator [Frankia sp. AgW1.1]MBL7551282.1 PadR family transcriptional regulator [Frankia sp. AgB1.9]MBL7621528.1 PadR family transcriptional regulator [Frankia sp. AgB1.8]
MKSHHHRSAPDGSGADPRLHHGPFRRHGHWHGHHPGPGMGPVPGDLGPIPGPPPMGPGPGAGPWGPGPWGPRLRAGHRGGGGGRGRAGRGDVRAAVLLLLADGPRHGYQLMQAIAERTGGAWQPSPGAVYPTISQLEDEGLVTVTADGGRRLVTITEAGQAHLAKNRDTIGDPFAAFTARAGRAGGVDLLGAVQELSGAVWQVARAGDAGQTAAAHKVLTDARRALYLLLAGEPSDAAGTDATGTGAAAAEAPAAAQEPPANETPAE